MNVKRTWRLIWALFVLILAILSCSNRDQRELEKITKMLEQTAAAEGKVLLMTAAEGGKDAAATAAEIAKGTLQAQAETQVAAISTKLFETEPSPWDVSWLPTDEALVVQRINSILDGSGLTNQGESILKYGKEYGVNPALAIAMFRQEASFARPGTSANANNNPGNIIATGDCRTLPEGSPCTGNYGEIGRAGRFGVYANMADGIKAFNMLLSREYGPDSRRNCKTIRSIIEIYAPAADNNDPNSYSSNAIRWTREYQLKIIGSA